MNQKQYIIYARKSTDSEERQVQSVRDQLDILTELAKKRGYKILRVLSESKSAKEPGRKVFNEMMMEIHEGNAQGILVWNPDRLTRNAIDAGTLIYSLDQNKLQEIVTPTQILTNTPSDKFLLNMLCSQAKLENDNRAINVKRGLNSKAQSGVYPGLAPTGYLNNKYAEKGNRNIIKDQERFETIKTMLTHVASQKYTPMEMFRIATQEWKFKTRNGLISRSTWYNILTDSFYYGKFEYPTNSGHWFTGNHEPMITEEQYDMIQAILGKEGKPRPKTHVFAYTGVMKCGECGAMITCEEKVKHQKNGNVHRYIYYHCTKRVNPECTQPSIEEKELNEQISQIVSDIEIPEEFHEWALKWLKEENKKESQSHTLILEVQQKTYAQCIAKIDALIDMRAGKEITAEEFLARKTKLEDEKKQLEKALTNIGIQVDKWLHSADEWLLFSETAVQKFRTGTIKDKRQILIRLGSDFTLKDKKLDINLENVIYPIKKVAKEVKAIHNRLEPAKIPIDKGELFALYSQSPIVLPLADVFTNREIEYEVTLNTLLTFYSSQNLALNKTSQQIINYN